MKEVIIIIAVLSLASVSLAEPINLAERVKSALIESGIDLKKLPLEPTSNEQGVGDIWKDCGK